MTSIYDKKDTLEKQRMDSDLIYHCLMSKDETVLNKMTSPWQSSLRRVNDSEP